MDDDDDDNEMIMQTINKNGSYGPFGPILTILAAENGKTKKKVVQNPTLACYRLGNLTN